MKRLGTVMFVLTGFTAGIVFVYSCGGGGSSAESGGLTWPAPIAATGQSAPYGTNDDGTLQAGVAWPDPRFTDNGDGTVTDNLTGLAWLKEANCFGTDNWSNALIEANQLATGSCSLTDGSSAGDWRLPNVNELLSLVDHGYYSPVVSNTAGSGQWSEGDPFSGIQSDTYHSSSTVASLTSYDWIVDLNTGYTDQVSKTGTSYVWPVRDAE